LNVGKGKYIVLYYKFLCKSIYDIERKSIGLIADAVTSHLSKDDANLLVYLETERLRAELYKIEYDCQPHIIFLKPAGISTSTEIAVSG